MKNHPLDGATVLEIKADPEQVRVLSDPFDRETKSRSIACVSVTSILNSGLGDWLDANVRLQKMSSRIARDIVYTLTKEPEKMHPLNRGLTILAKNCRYDSQRRVLVLHLIDPRRHGIIDGGHTFRAIADTAKNQSDKDDDLPNAYVNVEVLVGYDEIGPDIISARNSVCQVRDSAIYALDGVFDVVKKALEKADMLQLVSFKQNEQSDEKPVSIEEVIAIAMLFHPKYADGVSHPMRAYTSRAGCVETYAEEWKQFKEKGITEPWLNGYGKILPLIPDILRLSEDVELEIHEAFRRSGGLKGLLDEEEENGEREGREKGRKIKEFAGARPLPFTGKRTMHSWPSGYLYPVIASLRPAIDYSGEKACWRIKNPFLIFQECSPLLVKTLFAYADRFGRKPNAVGKNDLCWQALYNTVGLHLLRKNAA